jgi:hypothetical protein
LKIPNLKSTINFNKDRALEIKLQPQSTKTQR